MNHKKDSGIYNLGTGKARSFLDLANSVFAAINKPICIEFIDTPIDIRDKYQYFTEAPMEKLRSIGYEKPFYSLEAGIEEYLQGYLVDSTYFWSPIFFLIPGSIGLFNYKHVLPLNFKKLKKVKFLFLNILGHNYFIFEYW